MLLTTCSLYHYYQGMSEYRKLQEKAVNLAQSLASPSFYVRYATLLRRSEDALMNHELIRKCRVYLDESQMECAHGLCHCEAVARDAGVIVLVEAGELRMNGPDTESLFVTAIIAGLLHDINGCFKSDDDGKRTERIGIG